MDSIALLSPTDVNTIRRYVRTKYAPLSGDRQAEIVADAIRRTLQRRLPELPERMKHRLVDQLISRCLIGERRDVQPDDVLDMFAEWEDDGIVRKEQLMAPILEWMNELSPGRWSEAQLTSRMVRRKAGSPTVVPEKTEPLTLSEGRWRSLTGETGRLLRKLISPVPAVAALALVIVCSAMIIMQLNPKTINETQQPEVPPVMSAPPVELPDIGMPPWLKYAEVDADVLKNYLKSRDSLLVDEPFFGSIMASARHNDIHPLLLFAITGQEQGFVPRSGKDATRIANNPFNVGHSWMEYNTDTRDSADIASRLLVKLAKSRPDGAEPFEWFNRTYAEDPLWSIGVQKIFDKLASLPNITKAE
ncbi:hypothetical protein D7Z26_02580 [Cohnella endophytica]|uniref:Uncharacterized protein n=1 Tax=Cohnella endophytica TaxID=2419778 RepID=A0A494Y2C1_9BACL|nr:hypothetical protein [Cohnella endophytica]RKP56894.1 hypothetical protein D7Z26_02580 [Cohnella endophytica]